MGVKKILFILSILLAPVDYRGFPSTNTCVL